MAATNKKQLWSAAECGDLREVNRLLKTKSGKQQLEVTFETRELYPVTPLAISSYNGHMDVVKSLIKHGANINAGEIDSETAFLCACTAGHYDIAELLFERGASVNAAK